MPGQITSDGPGATEDLGAGLAGLLRPGDVVADIGCGTGYFSWRMAEAIGAKGAVYGVEIQPEMLDLLAGKMKERGVTNVLGVLGTTTDPKLPKPVV